MTNKKEVAQKVLEAYETSYTESGLVAALRELAFELQYYQCCEEESVEDMVLAARDVLDVCDELEVMTEEIDISKVLIEGDTATIMGVKYKRVEDTQPFYDKLWGLLKTKLGDTVDCDEMADKVRDLIREHIPEPKKGPGLPEYSIGFNECIRQIKNNLQLQ